MALQGTYARMWRLQQSGGEQAVAESPDERAV
jgi:hypothetical protein